MLRHKRLSFIVLAAAGMGAFTGCATAVPHELADARTSYQRAATGPASQLRLKELTDAERALRAANESFDNDPESEVTRSLAYVALRKAELAQVRATTVLAEREKAASEQQLATLSQDEQQKNREELATARAQLTEAQRTQLEARQRQEELEQQRLLQEQARAQGADEATRAALAAQVAQAQEQLRSTTAQLEAERQARMSAEQQVGTLTAAQKAADEKAREATEALQKIKEISVKEEARGTVVTLSGQVLFASGQAVLLPNAQRRLDDVAKALQDSNRTLVIEGHTDSRGSDTVNEALSSRRATAVREYLASRGLPSERLRAVGLGESRPVAENSSAEGRANNRRVEIVIERAVASDRSAPATTGTGGAGGTDSPR